MSKLVVYIHANCMLNIGIEIYNKTIFRGIWLEDKKNVPPVPYGYFCYYLNRKNGHANTRKNVEIFNVVRKGIGDPYVFPIVCVFPFCQPLPWSLQKIPRVLGRPALSLKYS